MTRHHSPFADQPCSRSGCDSASRFELKLARTSNHIFHRHHFCCYDHAMDWLAAQAAAAEPIDRYPHLQKPFRASTK